MAYYFFDSLASPQRGKDNRRLSSRSAADERVIEKRR